jgi:ABC-type sugar transport system substrate-binding protein/DNA-binding CsgD family transcriptional regulator
MDNTGSQEWRNQLSERELAILRLMAEGLSNQEIADRLFLALTTIKWYIRQINDKLDTHSRTQTVARAHQLKLVGYTDTSRVALAEAHEPPENPYKGLRAFQEADAEDFFGREALLKQLVERLEAARFLAVIGPSGSGKSSVVKAGLIPALRRGEVAGSERWLIAEMLPGTHPLEELEIALLRIATTQPPSLLLQLREDERGLLRAVRRVLPDDGCVLALVIDQFEEVLTLVDDPAERQHFLDSLCMAVADQRSPLRVILTLRADFYDRPLLHPKFGQLMHRHTEVVLPLTAEELEQAITRPAARVGLTVEPGLVAAMVADVSQQPGGLPLLQYTLTELFDNRSDGALTLEAYHAIGGVTGALARRADGLYQALHLAGQETARQMFLRLVTLGEGVEDTRRRVLQSELLAIVHDVGARRASPLQATEHDRMDDIIQTFAAYRLLTLDHDPATRTPTVELAHEAILYEWGRMRTWLDESRANVRQQRLLAHATAEWHRAGRDRGFLLSGSRLAQFEEWAADTNLALTADEQAYLDASVAERERQGEIERERQTRERRLEQRSRTFLRGLVVVLLVATLGAFGLTGVAVRNEAEARGLALASAAQLALNEGNTDQAIVLAQAALQITDNALARRVLDQAAFAPSTPLIFQEFEGFIPHVLTAEDTELTFAVVPHFAPWPRFGAIVKKGADDACVYLNVTCLWLGPDVGDSEDWYFMRRRWTEALAMNPNGIGTTSTNPDFIGDGIEQATERGIPVVVFNVARSVESERSLPHLLYIGSDDFVSGESNARRVFAEARADEVTIHRGVCIYRNNNHPSIAARCAGAESVFDEEGIPFDRLPVEGYSIEDELRDITRYFEANPDTNGVVWISLYDLAQEYVQQAGLESRQLYATMFESDPETFQMIRDGYLLQTIDQQPYIQGFQTIMSLYLYRQYGIRPSGFINTSSVIDRSNVDYVTQLVELGYR